MSNLFSIRAAVAVAALALTACAQDAPRDPRLTEALPPPGPISPGGQPNTLPLGAPAGAQDAVLRGAAFAQNGDGRFPPNSRMIVRVYDAASADVNRPIAEQSFTRSGGMPWPYELRVPIEALRALQRPAVAARIEGPRGELIYQNAQAVVLSEGGSDDIPMSRVGGGGGGALSGVPNTAYQGAPVPQGPQPNYGIPDYNASYGTPNYDTPVYPGQTFGSPSLSGPPSNITY